MDEIEQILNKNEMNALNSLEIDEQNAIRNLFNLAEIEDRFTEKEIIIDGCRTIKTLLRKLSE